jgi:hypothetical protein
LGPYYIPEFVSNMKLILHTYYLFQPFVEDEDVLVESENGKFLWDAVVLDVSKDPDSDKVNGYLVHFKNWSSRFDQWVVPERVVEPSTVNAEVQASQLPTEFFNFLQLTTNLSPHSLLSSSRRKYCKTLRMQMI